MLTALRKERVERYQTADEMRQDITRYLSDEPIVARRPTFSYLLRSRGRAFAQRHPVTAMIVVVAISWLAADLIGVKIVYYWWTPARDLYKNFLATVPWPAVGDGGFQSVVVIGLTDETAARVADLATGEGLTDVSWQNAKSLRRLHGRLMERLAAAGVISVTWNMTFRGETEFDEGFARGVKTLGDNGVDVVIAVRNWPLGDMDPPVISDNIANLVRWGVSTVHFRADAEWNIHLFVQRGTNDPVPSLVLTSMTSHVHPQYEVALTTQKNDVSLLVRYFQYTDPANPREKLWLPHPDEIVLVSVEEFESEVSHGQMAGDLVGIYIVEPPPDALLEAATVSYEWVFDAQPSQLRDRLGGKAVIIDNLGQRAESYPHPDGRTMPVVFGMATGMEMLIRGSSVRFERTSFSRAAILVGAILGVLIAVVSTGHLGRRVLLVLAGMAAIVLASIIAYNTMQYLFIPLVPVMAMIVAAEIAVWVHRARRARLA